MKLSLIYPLWKETRAFENLSQIPAFFDKFPVEVEVLLAKDPDKQPSLDLNSLSTKKVSFHLLENKTHQGRSRSILKALEKASGDIFVVASLDFSVPLSETFSFAQELLTRPDLGLAIGNRFTSRKKMTGMRTSWHQTLENIVQEKARRRFPDLQDLTSSFVGLRREAFVKMKDQLEFRSWYFTPELINAAKTADVITDNVPILIRNSPTQKIPLVREFLRHMF